MALPFTVSYLYSSRRRSISLEVRNAEVVIRAPKGARQSELEKFAFSKEGWVQAKIIEQQLSIARLPRYNYETGDEFPFLGEKLYLQVSHGSAGMIQKLGGKLTVLTSSRSKLPLKAQVKKQIETWYKKEALILLSMKTRELCDRYGLTCNKVTIRETRSKWGHCTALGDIQYNWKIMLAPVSVVDYLVVHEVCHLQHHNHSKAYWELVKRICPEFERERLWLRDEGFRLVL